MSKFYLLGLRFSRCDFSVDSVDVCKGKNGNVSSLHKGNSEI